MAIADLKHREITDKILHAFFRVVDPQLGYGFFGEGL